MMNVVGYCRVSTNGQVGEDKFGLDMQKKAIVDYCAKNDMNIARWFIDEGESGAKERPGFDEIAYGEITNPPYEAVIVTKNDRVARDIEVYYYYKMLLRKKDIRLISITEDFGKLGAFSDILETFTLCVAKMERENINKRTSGGRKIKAAKGGYSGGRPPYGYKSMSGNLIIVPEEADVIKDIIASKNKGDTFQAICNKLNSAGKVNRSGTKFSISTLQVIVGNEPLYRGMYRYGKNSEWVEGQHEPIL